MRPTGAGWRGVAIHPGIRRCVCSANRGQETGRRRLRASRLRSAGSVEIDIARFLSELRILFRFFEQLVEFAIEHLSLIFFGFERLAESLVAAARLALQFGHSGGQVLNHRRTRWLFMSDDGVKLAIDFQLCLAAGAGYFEQVAGHALLCPSAETGLN